MPLVTPDSEELGYSTYLAFARLRELVLEVPGDLAVRGGDVRTVVEGVVAMLGRHAGDEVAPSGTDVAALVAVLDAEMTEYLAHVAPSLGAGARGAMLGELLLRGRDIAQAAGRRWPLDPAEMTMALNGRLQQAETLVDPVATAGVRTSYVVKVRGGTPQRLLIEDGTAESRDLQHGDAADAVLGGSAVALGLLLYGRVSFPQALLRGAVVTGGRRPWRAWSLPRYLASP